MQHFKEFDVVETDLCRFDDLKSGSDLALDELPPEWRAKAEECVEPARTVASSTQGNWTVPHWVCGNFFIYWSKGGNQKLKSANTFDEILAALDPKQAPLLADMWGSTGLGEFYADALLDLYGPVEAKRQLAALAALPKEDVKKATLDPKAQQAVVRLAAELPPDARHHLEYFDGQGQLYPWMFGTNHRAALLGYSESLFFTELADDPATPTSSTRIMPRDIVIKPFPFGQKSQGTPSWVDGFVVPAGKLAAKRSAIEAFLKLATSVDGYIAYEEPENDWAAANLLPAYVRMYDDPTLKKKAPLLSAFRGQLTGTFVVNETTLWHGMRVAGKRLEEELSR